MSGVLNKLSQLFKSSTGQIQTSLNDLRDKEFSGKKLSSDEKLALLRFDTYRLRILNSLENEDEFHEAYRKLQVIANLGDWREFLSEKYSK